MALTYADVLDVLMTRAVRLGLVDNVSGNPDAAELELYMFQALLDIVELVDMPAFTRHNDNMMITASGLADYAMPSDFGRLIYPRVQNRRGIYIFNSVHLVDLEYVDPNVFSRKVSTINKEPSSFTIMERRLWLYPTPDANGTTDYTVRGVYIKAIDKPDLSDEVTFGFPTVLIDVALSRLAADIGKQVQALAATREQIIARLVAGTR